MSQQPNRSHGKSSMAMTVRTELELAGVGTTGVPVPLAKRINIRWKSAMDTMREAVSYVVLRVSNHAASNPVSYIVGILLFSLGLAGIGLLTNFDMSAAASESYTPSHSVIWEQMEWIEEESNYPPKPHSLRILIHQNGDNVLTTDGVHKTFDVVDQVQQTNGYMQFCVESEATNTYGFGGLCHIRGLPLLWNHSRDQFTESVSSTVDLMLQVSAEKYPDGADVEPRELMGHFTHLNGTIGGRDIIETAESFLMEIVFPAEQDGSKNLAIRVLDELRDLQKVWVATSTYRLELFLVDHSLESETLRAVFLDLPLIPMVFVVMALFTCVVFSMSHKPGGPRWQPRFLLGFGAVATVAMSLAASHGLLFIIGVPFTSLTQTLPFVMFGIGLDDAFIIYGEFIRTDEKKDPVERIRDTFEEVGLSIFLTTVTTTLAFGLGLLNSVPTLVWLSAYAFPTVIIDFIYQITFFVAIIVIDERRIAEAKRQKLKEEELRASQLKGVAAAAAAAADETPSSLVLVEVSAETSTSKTSSSNNNNSNSATSKQPEEDPVAPYTNTDDQDSESTMDSGDDDAAPAARRTSTNSIVRRRSSQGSQLLEGLEHYHHHVPGPPASGVDRFMKRYAETLLTTPVKIVVLLGFVALTIALSFATSNFRQEFNIYEVLTVDSYLASYFRNVDKYADTGFGVAKAYFRNVDQSDPDTWEEMQSFVDNLVEIDAISRQPPFFWVDHFKEFLTYDDRLLDLTFNQQLDIFLSIDHFKSLYADNIIRDENGDITTSRVVMVMDNIDMESVSSQIDAWRAQLNVTEKQPINAEENLVEGQGYNFFFHDEELIYTWEFYSIFKPELIMSTVLGVATVTVFAFLFLPHWSAACFLTPIISVLFIDLIGFLQVCGEALNGITYFTLIMSIGLLVDFNMHILLRYYESPCTTREAKVKDCLQTMGSSVVMGGLSTFLGVVPLLFSSSSLMKSLFYGFWGMVLLGCGHGVIVLPVILSYLGPVETYTMNPTASAPRRDVESSTKSAEESRRMALQNTPLSTFTSSPSSDSNSTSTSRPRLESDGEISTPLSVTKPQHLDSIGDLSEVSESSENLDQPPTTTMTGDSDVPATPSTAAPSDVDDDDAMASVDELPSEAAKTRQDEAADKDESSYVDPDLMCSSSEDVDEIFV